MKTAAYSDFDAESINSDLTSITSSVYNYQYENGRRYHAYRQGNYVRTSRSCYLSTKLFTVSKVLPNDEQEQERLDILHHVFRLTLDGALCRTQLENPHMILDVGTGTGIWAIESICFHFIQFATGKVNIFCSGRRTSISDHNWNRSISHSTQLV